MDAKNKNRIGYKKTKVGWIPEEWICVSLSVIAKKGPQNGLYKQQHEYSGSCRMVHMPQIFRFDYINNQEMPVVEMSQQENHYLLRKGDLLFARRSLTVEGAGKCSLVQAHNGPITFESSIIRITPDKKLLHPIFAFYYIHSTRGRYQMFTFTRVVAVSGIAGSDLKLYVLPLPPLPEQMAIAGVLECWDKVIRNYEKKIEKKRNIKKGLMQRLLSGKQRLPGFSGEWKEVAFGEVFEFLNTYAFSREQLTTALKESAGVYNIHYGDVHATYDGYVLDFEKERTVPLLKKTTAIPSNPVLLQEGDLIIADASEDYEGVGACVEIKNIGNRKVTGGLHTFVARDKRGHSALGYRSFLLKHPAFTKRMKQISTGVSVHGLSKGNLSKENISLPPLHEQQAIASVLSAADSEIVALERKLAQLKDQKKFLLNNLVTGTIRLPQFKSGIKNTGADGDHA